MATPEKRGVRSFLHISPPKCQGRKLNPPAGPGGHVGRVPSSPNPHGIPLSPETATSLARSQNLQVCGEGGRGEAVSRWCAETGIAPSAGPTRSGIVSGKTAFVFLTRSRWRAAPRGGRAEGGIKGRCGWGWKYEERVQPPRTWYRGISSSQVPRPRSELLWRF